MTSRTPSRPGALGEFCWMDLKTRDLPGTAAFFAATLGWRFAVDETDWRRATKVFADGRPIGGVSDLADPVYPPGTPAHVAYYLAVDDVDRRTGAATAHGARVIVPPFDAGDQGRMATLVDPVGAAFSLWQARRFGGWDIPAHATGVPHRMVLVCERPGEARRFYREALGTALAHADFVAGSTTGWELEVGVTDLDRVVARARDHGQDPVVRPDETGGPVVRLTGPEGLTFRVRRVEEEAG
ncbi:lactoylglutathione lyase [Streptomyces ruber]|uniref:Lactoylglutathione lyase n=2 Tax=Streptomyces TaxID=1883 RepID=A0A918BAD5_9ACTN|nr:VOC family protein [Streptomyces ruber]GGQ52445.1 lactoylglutathione lyase [Streptomyces ruber]